LIHKTPLMRIRGLKQIDAAIGVPSLAKNPTTHRPSQRWQTVAPGILQF
jgi:hypothetical protein